MWGRNRSGGKNEAAEAAPQPLKDAVRQARIESAERTGVVVDLRDAEAARLELLSEALDPVFAEIPREVELFDRGLSKGDVPRLWIDAIAHVAMGRDKRVYRFVQDTRFGRKVLAESPEIVDLVGAVTRYVAGRLVERDRALAGNGQSPAYDARRRQQRSGAGWAFVLGVIAGVAALFAAALFLGRP